MDTVTVRNAVSEPFGWPSFGVVTMPIPDCGADLAEIQRECLPLAPAFCQLCPRNPANAGG